MLKKLEDTDGCLIMLLPVVGLVWLTMRFPKTTGVVLALIVAAGLLWGGYSLTGWVRSGCPNTASVRVDVCTQTATGFECVPQNRQETHKLC